VKAESEKLKAKSRRKKAESKKRKAKSTSWFFTISLLFM